MTTLNTSLSVTSTASVPERRPNVAAIAKTCRSALIFCCAITAFSACWRPSTSAKPGNAPPSVEALIVSVDDVRRIANDEELTARAGADLRRPPPGDVKAPGPCRAVGISDLTFVGGWSTFRSAGYSRVSDDIAPSGIAPFGSVSQAVAVYPNWHAAHQALDQLESLLTACLALNDPKYAFSLDHHDSPTLRIAAQGWMHLYRVQNSVMISVGVVGVEPTERIATAVLQTVTDRIE
ncbi:sensor domain-containing protein [Mycobacterium paragordonae]|nr:sensor domain-containing protein [Mycobacterium paragordonae]TDL04094.1 sensor domain-containing protein [Mycobacterium paragordonae]